MKIFFDASVLVPLVNQESPHHAQALSYWTSASERVTSCHAMAEAFRTLTTLKKPLMPESARRLLDQLRGKIELVAGTPELYSEAMRRMAEGNRSGAMIYDALHCVAAGQCHADKIVTRNKPHFDMFANGIAVEALT